MKQTEKWGDSIEIAVELALQDLGLELSQVTVTVLEEPSKGFLGFGKTLAKVRVEEIAEEKETEDEFKEEGHTEAPAKERKKSSKPARSRKNKKKDASGNAEEHFEEDTELSDFKAEELTISEKPDNLVSVSEHPAKTFLEDVFKEMGISVNVSVSVGEDCVYIDVDGPDCGTVIGTRGQTLDSLQYLTSLVVNKGQTKYIRTVIDAEGYRKKREKTLERLAVRLAQKAVKTGRNVRLEPMNPYERKVIHSVLQKYPGVITKSEGVEPYRRVVILPE